MARFQITATTDGYRVSADLQDDEPYTSMWQREYHPRQWCPTRSLVWECLTYRGACWKRWRMERKARRQAEAFRRRQVRATASWGGAESIIREGGFQPTSDPDDQPPHGVLRPQQSEENSDE